MNCKRCGSLLNEGDTICKNCGEVVNNQAMNQVPAQPQGMSQQPVEQQGMPNPQPMPTPQGMPTPESQGMPQQPMNNMNPGMQPNMQQPMNAMPQQGMQQPMNYQNPGQGMNPQMGMNQMNGMNNLNAPQGMPQQPKKNGLFLVIIIFLVVAILGVGGFVVYKLVDNNDTKVEEKESKKDKDKDKDKDKEDEDDKDSDKDKDKDKDVAKDDREIELYYYKFTIPKIDGMEYEVADDLLTFSDGATYQVKMSILDLSYDYVVSNANVLSEELEAEGIKVLETGELNVNGRKFFCYDLGTNGILYVTKLDNTNSVYGIVAGKSDAGYEKGFEIAEKIIATADTASSFAPSTGNEGTVGKKAYNSLVYAGEMEVTEYKINE